MVLWAGLDGGKSRLTGIRSPDRPARSSVAIPTELPGSHVVLRKTQNSILSEKSTFTFEPHIFHTRYNSREILRLVSYSRLPLCNSTSLCFSVGT